MTTHTPPRATAQALGDLAEMLLPLAVNLARIVHGDGGREDVEEELSVLDEQQKDALIVVLAGLVDTDRPVCAALGWLGFDEDGRRIEPAWDDWTRLRDLADAGTAEDADDDLVDEVAVQAYMSGRSVTVTDRERLEAIVRGVRDHGLSVSAFDAMHGLRRAATHDFVQRERKRAEENGLPFPDLPDSSAPTARRFTSDQVVDMRERAHKRVPYIEIALAYGTSSKTVQRIVEGVSYPNLGGPIRPRKGAGAEGTQGQPSVAVVESEAA